MVGWRGRIDVGGPVAGGRWQVSWWPLPDCQSARVPGFQNCGIDGADAKPIVAHLVQLNHMSKSIYYNTYVVYIHMLLSTMYRRQAAGNIEASQFHIITNPI